MIASARSESPAVQDSDSNSSRAGTSPFCLNLSNVLPLVGLRSILINEDPRGLDLEHPSKQVRVCHDESMGINLDFASKVAIYRLISIASSDLETRIALPVGRNRQTWHSNVDHQDFVRFAASKVQSTNR
jgi:hypothetical protein